MALQFPYGTNSKKLKGGFISDSWLPHKKEDCIDFSTYWPAVSTIESKSLDQIMTLTRPQNKTHQVPETDHLNHSLINEIGRAHV